MHDRGVASLLPAQGALSTLLKSGMSLATKDVEGLTQVLVDAEMKMFAGLPTPVIFLQNVGPICFLGLVSTMLSLCLRTMSASATMPSRASSR